MDWPTTWVVVELLVGPAPVMTNKRKVSDMAMKRQTLEERIKARQARIDAEQKEIDRLNAIADNAGAGSEWVADLFDEYEVEAEPNARSEAARLAQLVDAIKASAGSAEDVEKLKKRASSLQDAVLKMARDLNIQSADQNEVWAQIKQRYQIQ